MEWKSKFKGTNGPSFKCFVVCCRKDMNLGKTYMSGVMRKPAFCKLQKQKTQISSAVTAQLISAFVFATQVVKSLYFLNLKFQASSHFLWLYSQVCVRPGRKPQRQIFSRCSSYKTLPHTCSVRNENGYGISHAFSKIFLVLDRKTVKFDFYHLLSTIIYF